MADASEARHATGYAIGGTPPFGHPAPIRTLIDPSLLDHETVFGAGGTPDRCFPIASATQADVTSAEVPPPADRSRRQDHVGPNGPWFEAGDHS